MVELKKNKKTQTGVVVSNKMDKTIVVRSEKIVRHKLYGKYLRLHVKYVADDQDNICNIGDQVMIEECRPLSKRKRWRLREIVTKAL
ncbi:MAG: 30S ribosomal protein S17 [Thermodesulfobacteriota bacterium]|nr:30S ribosomal protein S17 [Thermodesulfobacteriota bacterium]